MSILLKNAKREELACLAELEKISIEKCCILYQQM